MTGTTRLSGNEVEVGDIKVLTGGQVQKTIVGSIARTDTVAKVLGTLPAGAQIIGVTVYGAAVSNAGTTATVMAGYVSGSNHNEILPAYDVKGATGSGTQTPTTAVCAKPTAPQTVQAIYAETGTASTSGGPWLVSIEFVTSTS